MELEQRVVDLSPYKIIAFATHALVGGEFGDGVEPSLVLTPPRKPTGIDNGLLTASDVSELKLSADWVILSACNTAASDGTPGAEGLSGLARGFFVAGARSLLVTHWPVESKAAVKLTTTMFAEYSRGKTRAEALRASVVAMMDDKEPPEYAHPMSWAAFFIVGEGGGPQL